MASKPPTNAQILTEIRTMRELVASIDGRLHSVEVRNLSEDVAKKAVAEYKQSEYRDQEQKSLLEIFKQLAPFIAVLTALGYALLQVLHK